MEDFLQVGAIIKTHGIRGEVKVYPLTDDVNRFKELDEVILEPEDDNVSLKIEGVKYYKNLVILKFKDFDNINDIEPFVKKGIYVNRENAVACEEDEYFIADLIGLNVVTDEGKDFGIVKDVLPTGANDVYVIAHEGKEVLVPAIKQCILDVSLEDKVMTIHLLNGLV
ncbi:MAG: ribosome maturation factor RimM [Lachnospiraceae bacterium]|nr:ribosome maturation factor RimM [Lachnospiraceae bacterium]